jgi:hypothetical protein
MLTRNFFQGFHYLSFCSLMSWEANPADLGGGSSGESTEETSESQGSEQPTGYSSFAQEILKGVPQDHLPILEPHLKKWDAGTTRRFQDLQNQYKHYSNLGWDEETTQHMAEVYRVLNEEPERLYEALANELGLGEQEQNDESTGGQSAQEFQGLPPEIQARIDQQEQILQALATVVLEGQTKQQESMEDSEFESYLGLLKQEYGNFDEEYVCSMIANGMDGEAAVKQWMGKVQEAINQANGSTEHLPDALLSSSGGGAVPQQESQKLGQIPQKDIRSLIANVMGQANQAAQ